MIRHLKENAWAIQTTSVPGADQAATRFSLPEGVREVIGKRLSRLSEPTNELLQIAAVIGRTFDLALLVEVTGKDEAIVLPLLAEAIRATLVAEVAGVIDRFEFTHALIQETLRIEVPTSLRVRLHRGIAQGIERVAGRGSTITSVHSRSISARPHRRGVSTRRSPTPATRHGTRCRRSRSKTLSSTSNEL